MEKPNTDILSTMSEVRRIVSLALEARAKAGVKVRQPLARLTVKNTGQEISQDGLVDLIKEEINVKEITFDKTLQEEVVLDTAITPELKKEGQFRDLVRAVQELRKLTGLTPSDSATLTVTTDERGRALIEEFANELKKTSILREIIFGEVSGEPVEIDGMKFVLVLAK